MAEGSVEEGQDARRRQTRKHRSNRGPDAGLHHIHGPESGHSPVEHGDQEQGLRPRSERDAECDTGQLQSQLGDRDDPERHVDQHGQDRRRHRRDRIAVGVERPRQDRDHRLGRERDQQHEQHPCRQLNASLRESAVVEEQAHCLGAEDHADHRDRQHYEQDQPDRPRYQRYVAGHFATRDIARHRRQRHDAHGLADDPERDLERGEGEREGANRTRGEPRRERGRNEKCHLAGAETQRTGRHEHQSLPGVGIR